MSNSNNAHRGDASKGERTTHANSNQLDVRSRRFYLHRMMKVLGLGVFANLVGKNILFAGENDTESGVKSEGRSEPVSSTGGRKPQTKPDSGKEEIDYKAITKAEWKKRLKPQQYKVAREHGTERAFSGEYFDSKEDGVYLCVCCEAPLFDSVEKFDSKTGWPSFWQPKKADAVGETTDFLIGYPRTEIHCSRCDAHLGHVFKDAPQTPTGLRYCINSVCLSFVPRAKAVELKKVEKAN